MNPPPRDKMQTCFDCNGRGGHYTGRGSEVKACVTCQGAGNFGYMPDGRRVAYSSKEGKWVEV